MKRSLLDILTKGETIPIKTEVEVKKDTQQFIYGALFLAGTFALVITLAALRNKQNRK